MPNALNVIWLFLRKHSLFTYTSVLLDGKNRGAMSSAHMHAHVASTTALAHPVPCVFQLRRIAIGSFYVPAL